MGVREEVPEKKQTNVAKAKGEDDEVVREDNVAVEIDMSNGQWDDDSPIKRNQTEGKENHGKENDIQPRVEIMKNHGVKNDINLMEVVKKNIYSQKEKKKIVEELDNIKRA